MGKSRYASRQDVRAVFRKRPRLSATAIAVAVTTVVVALLGDRAAVLLGHLVQRRS